MSTPEPTSKTCSRCKITKPFNEFGMDKRRKFGKNYNCKTCAIELKNAFLKEKTGTPCAKCKTRPRLSYANYCDECNRAYKIEEYKRNIETYKKSNKLYHVTNAEKIKKRLQEYRERRKQKEKELWSSRLENQGWKVNDRGNLSV